MKFFFRTPAKGAETQKSPHKHENVTHLSGKETYTSGTKAHTSAKKWHTGGSNLGQPGKNWYSLLPFLTSI